jgi:hypothetical protein
VDLVPPGGQPGGFIRQDTFNSRSPVRPRYAIDDSHGDKVLVSSSRQKSSASMKKISVETFIQMMKVMAIRQSERKEECRNFDWMERWLKMKKMEKRAKPGSPQYKVNRQ